MIQTSLEGDKRLAEKLKNIPDKTVNKGLRKGTRAAAKIVLSAAKQMIPADTGELKRSLKVRAMRRKKGRVGCRVTTSLFYAAFQDKGFTARNGRIIPGKYFLKTAIVQEQSKAIAEINKGVWAAIEEEVNK